MDFSGNCEITEARPENRPPIWRKGYNNNKALEVDINKLFESINLRTSRSLDLSDVPRNASKRPIRGNGSHSPGIGFSDPVSLKQALRGLCISQAAEMAAIRRMSMPASPRVSEAAKIASPVIQLYRREPKIESPSDISSGSSLTINEIDPVAPAGKGEYRRSKQDKEVSGLNKAGAVTPKIRQKSRLQTGSSSSMVKGIKDLSSTRSTSRAVKPLKNKNIIIRKTKKTAVSPDGNSKSSHVVVNADQDDNSGKLVCQKCQCSLKALEKDPYDAKDCDGSKTDAISADVRVSGNKTVVKTSKTSKTCEKGDISQSSQSSICDFSSSTASISDESNLSGSGCANRPHMSKDARWEAIYLVRKQYGFLGLNHFSLLKKLGSGDIGTVYLAELMGTNCLFAIKVMDNEFLVRRKKMPRSHSEREILKMLDHPFVPTLYAQFTSDNLSCLVMDFCPGGDLHVLRQKQPGRYFPEQAARFYVAEVLLALEYLHMLGIVYRDLKPENILVREDGHIMLTDFDLSLRCSVSPTLVQSSSLGPEPPRVSGPCAGSNCIDPFCAGPSCKVSCFSPRFLPARKLKADSASSLAQNLPQLVAEPTEARSDSFVGTHEYLAPEIVKGEGHGSSVDWWTLGVFLYELLYGKTPFKGAGNEETLANVVLQNLKFPDTTIVSFQARDLIRSLLVKEPENRLGTETGSAEIKRHPFFEGLNWALIRCSIPPQIPEVWIGGSSQMVPKENGKRLVNQTHTKEKPFEMF